MAVGVLEQHVIGWVKGVVPAHIGQSSNVLISYLQLGTEDLSFLTLEQRYVDGECFPLKVK